MLPRISFAGIQLMPPVPPSALQLVSLAVARKLLGRAAPPAAWGLSAEQFQIALERSAVQRFSAASPAASILEKYLDTLNLADLALATACSAGNSAAWDFFVANFRPELYRAARAIVGGSGGGSDAAEPGARDLADCLYADLYGLRESEGKRKSLFDYFHGRSKLTTWLRAILAQRHVDQFRRSRRLDPLDDSGGEESSQPVALAAAASFTPDTEREKYLAILQAVLIAALGALAPRDRLRLAYYYANDLTLAQIGKLLGEHEATVSRKLDRTRGDLRHQVERVLRDEKKLSDAQLRLCFDYAREEWPFDLTGALSARE
jgi:RNA polymerase sigma-70 factor (ECF subfamily)